MSGPREATVFWKTEWTEALRGHLAAGLSASMAAAEMNSEFRTTFTRCAVIGKARREDIPLAPAKVGAPRKPRPPRAKVPQRPDIAIRKAASGPKKPAEPYVPIETNIPPGATPLLDLDLDGCKWASGDGPFVFCNRPVAEGLPYCRGHAALAYRPAERRR